MRRLPFLLALCCAPAWAQRADDNVVTAAADAFGASLGRESIGLYDEGSVRGFSPERAGNIRIEGLYFDRRAFLTGRLRAGSTIQVGLTAIDAPFPAPTGIADIALHRPGDKTLLTVLGGTQPFGGALLEADLHLPLTPELGVQLNSGAYLDGYGAGGHGVFVSNGVVARWRPAAGVEITPFWGQADARHVDQGPLYSGVDGALPPPLRRRRLFAPKWAALSFLDSNFGLIVKARLADGWRLDAGLFRSIEAFRRGGTTLLTDIAPNGSARGLVISDRDLSSGSVSGEARLTREFATGQLAHRATLALRGRAVALRYGGSAETDLGPQRLNVAPSTPEPVLAFGAPTRDRTRQATVGLGWATVWPDVLQGSVGLQRSDYRKRVATPGAAVAERRDRPWLWNAAIAATVTRRLTIYAGASRGLEENGVAPDDAVNRDEALPALLTRQLDAGARLTLGGGMTLIAGAFDIRKPYFARDRGGVFVQQGEVRHRGVEASVLGSVAPGLTLVAGALALDPTVSGAAVASGAIGRRPVGRSRLEAQATLDWRPGGTSPWSVDAGLFHDGARIATSDNRVRTPAATTLDLGLRYRFRLGGRPMTLRAQLLNLTDDARWEVASDALYNPSDPRTAQVTLTADL